MEDLLRGSLEQLGDNYSPIGKTESDNRVVDEVASSSTTEKIDSDDEFKPEIV